MFPAGSGVGSGVEGSGVEGSGVGGRERGGEVMGPDLGLKPSAKALRKRKGAKS